MTYPAEWHTLFNNSSWLAIRDLAFVAEEGCPAQRVGRNSGSFLAQNVMDPAYANQFDALTTAMTMHGVPR